VEQLGAGGFCARCPAHDNGQTYRQTYGQTYLVLFDETGVLQGCTSGNCKGADILTATDGEPEHLRQDMSGSVREEPGCDDDDPMPAEAAAWPAPTPFDRIAVPESPAQLLPDWHRRFVEAVALETETAPDLAALSALTTTAAACARRFSIEQRPGFCVPAN